MPFVFASNMFSYKEYLGNF